MPQKSHQAFDGKTFARTLATGAGVYLMRDAEDKPLYVGKARNLRRRVASYFDGRDKGGRINLMVARTASMEVNLTRTEAEALLLENEWIKSLRPRYNINLRDDKSYPWIRLTGHQDFPRVAFYRGGRRQPGEYFGPYSSAGAVREALNQVYRLFGIRQCADTVFANRSRPCLQYQIARCSAPCVGYISRADYGGDVAAARAFLQGKSDQVLEHLASRMREASARLDFETAAAYRDRIQAVQKIQANQYVTDGAAELDVLAMARSGNVVAFHVVEFRHGNNVGSRTLFPGNVSPDDTDSEVMAAFVGQYYAERKPPAEILLGRNPGEKSLWQDALSQRRGGRVRLSTGSRGQRARWLAMAGDNAADGLRRRLAEKDQIGRGLEALADLVKLPSPPGRIECFDISHISGSETVGACVVLTATGLERKSYRHYNIEGITPGDDYAALAQVLKRRYQRALAEQKLLPDLVVIDGGRGQTGRARAVLAEFGLDQLPVIGIAKGAARRSGHETWILAGREVKPGPQHPASLLLQRIRDEAHRFAIRSHRKRRQKGAEVSPLESIPGIGPKRRRALLTHFGGLEGIRGAGIEELERVPGVSRRLAGLIFRHLRD